MSENSIALTIDEASEYTGIGRNTLRQLIAELCHTDCKHIFQFWLPERRLLMAKGSVRKKGKKWYYRYYV